MSADRDRAAEAADQVAFAMERLHAFVDELIEDLRHLDDEVLVEMKATFDDKSKSAETAGDWNNAVWQARWAVLAASLDVARAVAKLG